MLWGREHPTIGFDVQAEEMPETSGIETQFYTKAADFAKNRGGQVASAAPSGTMRHVAKNLANHRSLISGACHRPSFPHWHDVRRYPWCRCVDVSARSTAWRKGPIPEAPFLVSAAGDTSVLVDTKSGKTWVLTRAVDGESVWLPAQRIETLEEARNWRVAQKRLGEERIFAPKK
jgi:hypothetical protein